MLMEGKMAVLAPVRIQGRIVQHLVNRGSKSERTELLLDTPDDELELRVLDSSPFSYADLEDLLGRQVEIEGYLENRVLFLRELPRLLTLAASRHAAG
jgi:hypothetical protein